jgi:hypothetical protein
MTPNQQLLEQAKILAESVETWADLSNELFSPIDGLLSLAFPTKEERALFQQTEEYEAIRQLLNDTIVRTGLIDGAIPKKIKVSLDAATNSN